MFSRLSEVKPQLIELTDVPSPYFSDAEVQFVADEHKVSLSYRAREDDERVRLSFAGVDVVYWGWPNDEAFGGHRLAPLGASIWTIYEVLPSDLVDLLERGNRVHPNHYAELFARLRHILIGFQDNTFECVFRDLEISQGQETRQWSGAAASGPTSL